MTCPICQTPAVLHPTGGDYKIVDSSRAGGRYRITDSAERDLKRLSDRQKAILTTWIMRQHSAGVSEPVIKSSTIDWVLAQSPMPYGERVNRFFDYIAEKALPVGEVIHLRQQGAITRDGQELTAALECISDREAISVLNLLAEQGYIIGNSFLPDRIKMNALGYERLDQSGSRRPQNGRVFVATWFDDTMEVPYESGIREAILDAGYSPVHLGKEHYADSINDRIIAEIRQCEFVVADFTCGVISSERKFIGVPRANVYYEAGFAKGLNIPVICTVSRDCLNYIHFDTMQFPHIVWDDPADIRTKLRDRIISLFGATDRRRPF